MKVLGRLASQIVVVLQGKDKPTYTPHIEKGDICVAVNANEVAFTGRKLTDKFYRWHIGYVGHLKERSLKEQMRRDPTKVIRKVVFRMLRRIGYKMIGQESCEFLWMISIHLLTRPCSLT